MHQPSIDALELIVANRQVEADGVISLSLKAAAGHELPEWMPGAHIDLALPNDCVRQYSLCGSPSDRNTWRIGVLLEREGRGGSQYIHENVRIGSQIVASQPRNHFPLKPAPSYLFIAGGIGITPILPMVAAANSSGTPWKLFYGGRSLRSMAFVGELSGYGDRLSLYPQDERGLIDLDSIFGEQCAHEVYCCGPEALIQAVEQKITARPACNLNVERFKNASLLEQSAAGGFEIELKRSGRILPVAPHESILDALQRANVKLPFSCREGNCGTCELKVIAGRPEHRDTVLTSSEKASGKLIMACVSRSLDPLLVLDL
jgi:ferredoxin-NADP reductase